MKKAKVSKGVVHHVWPWVKTLPDGTKLTKELPPQYQGLNGKPVPECIVDVPDEVQPGWFWDGTQYVAPKPIIKQPRKMHSDLIEVLSEYLDLPYDKILKEVMKRKKARYAPKAD